MGIYIEKMALLRYGIIIMAILKELYMKLKYGV